jgi:threonine aldolase
VESLDSFTICFSKGLGAPVGSVLCGSKELISKARRWRKAVGGGMRQAGILAAGCIFALDNNIERLAEDHENAKLLAEGLQGIDELEVHSKSLNTNMFWFTPQKSYSKLTKHLAAKGIVFPRAPNIDGQVRLVTHLDVSRSEILRVINDMKSFYAN